MSKESKQGQQNKYDLIRHILREHSSREEPIGVTKIASIASEMGCAIGRNAIENFMNEMCAKEYATEKECDEYLREWRAEEREIIFCKTSNEGRRAKGYWMLESISRSEWMYLLDSVLYSKILTKKEADNLAKRIVLLAGGNFSKLTEYRCRMNNQPFLHGDEKTDEAIGHMEGRVLGQVYLIRKAIDEGKKVKFNLNVYKYDNQKVKLVPCGKFGRICSPFEVVYSNGRYYMLGADLETERKDGIRYKLYRIDLMTDLSITRAVAATRDSAGIDEVKDLFKFRIENPYMFTGKVQKVRLRVDSEQFTQIVDWFGDHFKVIGYDANEEKYYDIEVSVNANSFIYWVLQYSGCVTVLEAGKKEGEQSFRNRVIETLKATLKKYEEGWLWK